MLIAITVCLCDGVCEYLSSVTDKPRTKVLNNEAHNHQFAFVTVYVDMYHQLWAYHKQPHSVEELTHLFRQPRGCLPRGSSVCVRLCYWVSTPAARCPPSHLQEVWESLCMYVQRWWNGCYGKEEQSTVPQNKWYVSWHTLEELVPHHLSTMSYHMKVSLYYHWEKWKTRWTETV